MNQAYDFSDGVHGKYATPIIARNNPDCQMCADLGFVRINGTDEVVPCPKCNEDGMDEVTG